MTTNPRKKKNGEISWRLVIILLFLFYPAAVILLFKKLNAETEKMQRNGQILLSLGAALFLLSIYVFYSTHSATLHGRAAFLRALILPSVILLFSLFLICTGAFYTRRSRKDRKLIRMICEDNILDLSDLSLLMACPSRALLVRLDRLLEEDRLPGIEAIRNLIPQEEPVKPLSEKVRNALWIITVFQSLSFIFVPAGLALTAITTFLEFRKPPRNYRVIFICACISIGMIAFFILTVGLSTFHKDPLSSDGTLIFRMFLPGLAVSAAQMLCYRRLAARKCMQIREIRAIS